MKRFKRILSIAIVIAVLAFLVPASVVYADQDNPDSIPTMTANAYRNLLETGDQLYIFYANIPYSSIPDALVTEAFLWRLIDTDNSTELGAIIGTAFNDSGYGYNVYSMYFAAADAPTWNQEYIVRLSGNPTIFDDPPSYDFLLGTGDYSALTVTADVQDELALRILNIATDLDIRWGLTTATTLITNQETGRVLSLNGEAFFRSAIFGLQALAPGVFQIATGTITAADRTWTSDYSENITGQYAGTFIGTGQAAGAAFFSKDYDLLSLIILVGLAVALIVANVYIKSTIWAGMIDVTLLLVIMARIGIPAILLTFMGLVGAICWVYISGKIWGVVR